MQSQKSIEENAKAEKQELIDEVYKDFRKAQQFPTTVIGRKRFRGMRTALSNLGIPMPILLNSAFITHRYCDDYGKEEDGEWLFNRRKIGE